MTRAPDAARSGASISLATRPFVVLCCAMFLGYANQWMLMPVLPLYVDALGGSTFLAGLALLAFSIPSFAVRPYVGRIADRWNAPGVLAVGLVLLMLGSLAMLWPLLLLVFVGNIVRGLGWAGVNTGGYTTLAAAAPAQRRGEAAGYYTSATSGAAIVFPALGLWLLAMPGAFSTVLLAASAITLLGLPFALLLARAAAGAHGAQRAGDGAAPGLLDRGVLIATGLNLCSTLAMPAVIAFLPLYARSLGVAHIGLFYVLSGAINIAIRPLLGRWSDAIGRGPAIGLGLGAQLTGLALIFMASDLALILIGGAFVAIGMALIGATTTALAMDLANPRSRGHAMATFSISFQLGAGVGGIIAGAAADALGLRGMYAASIAITVCGVGLLAAAWKQLPRPSGTASRR
ncbi:MAG: MFS transporter [Burkholderiales bacterium]|nr:MFS transporter [Burkholderiales bacterium]